MASRKKVNEEALERSVVKLFTVKKRPNYYQPWDLGYQETSGGSGCILAGNRILTNAHVVCDQVYVQALRTGGTTKFDARVEFVDHDSETALLTVDDPEFFKGSRPVEFGDIPVRRERVAVHGFPSGGDELSITEGIVSRIEVHRYTHSQRDLLALQTDAAINPGNSGGPVFKDGKLVGIAFESYSGQGLENTGYAVPITVIRHFLEDVKDGIRDGVPGLGCYWQKMDSRTLRAFHRMKRDQTGILVTRVLYGSSSFGVLKENDVILEIDGYAVANDGSVQYRKSERLNFSFLVTGKHVGEKLELLVLRGGRSKKLCVTLKKSIELIPRPTYDSRPTYFIFAGILFMPLTFNYMNMWDWKDIQPRFRYYYNECLPSARRKQIVIISQVLAHEINVGYHKLRGAMVEKVNGRPITELSDVLRALKKPIGKYHLIEIDDHSGGGEPSRDHTDFGTHVTIDAAMAEKATREILARYGIPSDRSSDV
jgi:S1-C subfamily serine protease